MNNPFSLKGKTILVTGASSGIGRSIAVECSRMGASIIIMARDEKRLEETLFMLEGNNHSIIQADLNDLQKIPDFIKDIPLLDGVVHNAGVNNKMPVKFITEKDIEDVFRVNFYAPVLITQSLLKHKRINKEASVLMISSIAASYATISNTIYSSSKGALNAFLKVLALELSSQKIRVNGIQPGMVRTDILKAYTLQDELKEFENSFPLGRLGEPEDIAYAAVYMLSDASKWVTGSILTIDGGLTLR